MTEVADALWTVGEGFLWMKELAQARALPPHGEGADGVTELEHLQQRIVSY